MTYHSEDYAFALLVILQYLCEGAERMNEQCCTIIGNVFFFKGI
jgi:hypothetical protein